MMNQHKIKKNFNSLAFIFHIPTLSETFYSPSVVSLSSENFKSSLIGKSNGKNKVLGGKIQNINYKKDYELKKNKNQHRQLRLFFLRNQRVML